MSRNNVIAFALVVIVLLGSGVSFWLERGTRQEERKAASAEVARPAASSTPSSAAIARSLVPRGSGLLPPADTPVKEFLGELKALAAGGNSAAGCRLAFELERCYNIRGLQQQAARAAYRLEQGNYSGAALQAAQTEAQHAQERHLIAAANCEGVPAEEKADAWRYLLRAARAGHGPSMMRYAGGAGIPAGRPTLEVIDGWIAYRDESQRFLDRAIELGYPEAYEIGKHFYARGGHWGLKVPADRAKAVALQIALVEADSPGDGAAVEKALTNLVSNFQVAPEEVARGRSLAAPYAAKLKRRAAPGSFDFARTIFPDDGNHCER